MEGTKDFRADSWLDDFVDENASGFKRLWQNIVRDLSAIGYAKGTAELGGEYLVDNANFNPKYFVQQYMTDEEKNVLNYYRSEYGDEKAKEYLEALMPDLYMRDASSMQEISTDAAGESKFAASVLPSLMQMQTSGEGYNTLIGHITGEEVALNDPRLRYTRAYSQMRESVESDMSPTGQFFYETGMSMLDNLARLPLGKAGLGVMAGSVFAQSTDQALQNGATPDQAVALGASSAVIEVLTEKISLENLMGILKGAKGGALKNLAGSGKEIIAQALKQAGFEASEEMASEVLNLLANIEIMGDESEWEQLVQSYMQKGATRQQAEAKAFGSKALDTLIAGLGGAISGGVMGGGSTMLYNYSAGLKSGGNAVNALSVGTKAIAQYKQDAANAQKAGEGIQAQIIQDIGSIPVDIATKKRMIDVTGRLSQQPVTWMPNASLGVYRNFARKLNNLANRSRSNSAEFTAKNEKTIARLNALYSDVQTAYDEAKAALDRGDLRAHSAAMQKVQKAIETYKAAFSAAETENAVQETKKAEKEAAIANEAKSEAEKLDNALEEATQYQKDVADGIEKTAAVQVAAQQDAEIISGMAAQTGTQYQSGVTRMDSGKKLSRNARQQLRVLDGLGKKYNTPIVVEDTITRTGKDGRVYSGMDNAYYDPKDGSIHVALDAEEGAYMFFAVHELVHKIETESSEMYTILHDFVIDKLNANDLYAQLSKGEGNTFDERVASVMELYAKNGVELTRKQAESEIIADAIPVILTDKQTVQEFVRTDRTLAERIRDFFEDFFDELTQIVAQLAFGDANKAEVAALMADQETVREIADLFTAALESTNNSGFFSETAKNGEYITNYDGNQTESGESIEGNGDVLHSIVSDGRYSYVVADREVIHGEDPKQWAKQITDYINTEIRKGKDVTVLSENGVPLTITKDTAGKAAFRNYVELSDGSKRLMTDDEYALKLRAESHIDELAVVSRGEGGRAADTKGHVFSKDGFNYRVAYFADETGYYKLRISVGRNGRINTIYNVGRIEKTAFPTRGLNGPTRSKTETEKQFSNSSIRSSTKKSNTTAENSEENFYNDLVNSGDQPRLSVKSSGRDSEGNTLSEGQAEYFKDSKMRDDDGNLLVVYHGSPAYDEITTFKRGKKGWLGSGIYVTSRKSDSGW